MGLDISHDCFHGAYSSFADFRRKLCEVSGYGRLGDMKGFCKTGVGKQWPDIEDPMIKLLNHSDCDGDIKWKDCLPLALRLREILPSLAIADTHGHLGFYESTAKQFIKGLMSAHKKKQNVVFG